MVRIAVLVSGGGTNLQALIDTEKKGGLGFGKISLCVSSKEGAYALTRAKEAGIPSNVISKPQYKNTEEYTKALISLLKENDIDLVILAGFMVILPDAVIAAYRDRIINVHPSLIPSFCGEGFYGLKVHEAALDYGVKVTGATVHYVSEVVDGGKIIMQKAVDIQEGDTPETLQKRVMEQAEWVILPKAVSKVCEAIEREKSI